MDLAGIGILTAIPAAEAARRAAATAASSAGTITRSAWPPFNPEASSR